MNDGTNTVAAAGGSFLITRDEGFTNNGTISIGSGDLLEIEPGFGTFTNAASAAISTNGTSQLVIVGGGAASQVNNLGTITLGNGGTLNLPPR